VDAPIPQKPPGRNFAALDAEQRLGSCGICAQEEVSKKLEELRKEIEVFEEELRPSNGKKNKRQNHF
jgi:hypothetical protein